MLFCLHRHFCDLKGLCNELRLIKLIFKDTKGKSLVRLKELKEFRLFIYNLSTIHQGAKGSWEVQLQSLQAGGTCQHLTMQLTLGASALSQAALAWVAGKCHVCHRGHRVTALWPSVEMAEESLCVCVFQCERSHNQPLSARGAQRIFG